VTPKAPPKQLQAIAQACAAVRADVERRGSADDVGYFNYHEQRLRATAERIVELVPTTLEVLDIGGHYLHLSSVLALLGYRMSAIDVPAFAALPLVVERAARTGVTLAAVAGDDIAAGRFLSDQSDRFGAVLFCEILEHITFNPIAFWRRVHTLLRPGGMILVTTPNSLKLLSVLGALWNLLSLRRIGLSVKQIMHHGTFGHHWKEYSSREIVEYFGRLSPDFSVKVRKIHYGAPSSDVREAIGAGRTAILRFGNATGFFADNLEAVVTLPKKTPWSVLTPTAG
jgi:2-polyprenyl-6-hydroxyphenyl methylase/3-demethylubiquinone-9 3-methyltransferase